MTAQCDGRLEALAELRGRVEGSPLSTEPSILLSAYDDLYNLAVTTAYTKPNIIQRTAMSRLTPCQGQEARMLFSNP